MKPGIKHVQPLEKYDSRDFADWLRSGLEDLGIPERHTTAFRPLHHFVGLQDDLTRELKNIYDLLSGTARKRFREGMAMALADLPPESCSLPSLRELLHLAGRIKAVEVLSTLVSQIGNGYFGTPRQENGSDLFALALDIVSGMAPGTGVTDALHHLVNSSFFLPDYSPMAFVALCRTDPEHFPEHLKLLRGFFEALHRHSRTAGATITAQRFVHYVPLDIIARRLCHIELTVDPAIDELKTDNWLGYAFFVGDDNALRLRRTNEQLQILRRDTKRPESPQTVCLDWDNLPKTFELLGFLNRVLHLTRRSADTHHSEASESLPTLVARCLFTE